MPSTALILSPDSMAHHGSTAPLQAHPAADTNAGTPASSLSLQKLQETHSKHRFGEGAEGYNSKVAPVRDWDECWGLKLEGHPSELLAEVEELGTKVGIESLLVDEA